MRLFRTLLRINKINNENVYVVIPGWNPEEIILNIKEIPEEIVSYLLNGGKYPYRCHIDCDLNADNKDALNVCNWEFDI